MPKAAKSSKEVADSIVREYEGKRPEYKLFTERCRTLVEELLRHAGIPVLSVTCREKDPVTLREKLVRADKKYARLNQVTDLAGLRVITYMADEVGDVARVIEEEFTVLPEHSLDQSELLDPDRFGYLSNHFVCKLNPRRTRLGEYKPFKGLVFEIQIRSILQHAWAEIEHDLGYKTPVAIPRAHRRRFSRLAALLETADEEFTRLKNDLSAYAANVEMQIATDPSAVLLDRVSFNAFVKKNRAVRTADKRMAHLVDARLVVPDDEWVGKNVAALQFVGLRTIGDVEVGFRAREDLIFEQWGRRTAEEKHEALGHGISLYHLWQVVAAESGDLDYVKEALRVFWGDPRGDETFAKKIIGLVQELKASPKSKKPRP